MVCETPVTATFRLIVPAEPVEQLYAETTPVPLVEGCKVVVLLKLQLGVVFKVKE
jgi:hypothetical protein